MPIPTMVPKGTVYQSAFKARNNVLRQSWEENVGYRQYRRNVECNHSGDPFIWPEEEVFLDDDLDCVTPKRPASVPEHKYKHEKLNEAYKQKLQSQLNHVKKISKKESSPINGVTDLSLPLKELGLADAYSPTNNANEKTCFDKTVQTTARLHSKKRVRHVAVGTANGNIRDTKNTESTSSEFNKNLNSNEHNKESKQEKKNIDNKKVFKKTVPKPRPMTAPLGRPPVKPTTQTDERPPFLPYGYHDDVAETGRKKTHNVRASNEVYPAAVKAWRRRQVEIEEKEHEEKVAPLREKRQKALFNDKFYQDPSKWDTEYRKNFVGYRDSEYNNNLQMRLNPHRVWELYSPR